MSNLKQHYNNIIIYNLISKFNYNNIFKIPKLKKIILNIGFINSNIEKKKIISIILLLNLITNQTTLLTKSKKNKIIFKIKKGNIVGCKITLRNQKMYDFIEKLFIFIFPNIKNFKGFIFPNKNYFNFQISNILNFFELEKEFLKFQQNIVIDISIHTYKIKNIQEFKFLLNHFNFNFFK